MHSCIRKVKEKSTDSNFVWVLCVEEARKWDLEDSMILKLGLEERKKLNKK